MNLLYLTVPGALAAATALAFAIPSLVQRARLQALATLAVEPEQEVDLPGGEIVLHLGGPLGTSAFGSLSFDLIDPAGTHVPSAPIVVRSKRSSGAAGVLLAVRRFQLARPGRHRLQVSGIDPRRDLSACRLLLARPQDARLVLNILAVVVSSVALVACSVLSLVLWLGSSATTP
ncbi:MAG TPA: hypothetical protein VEZ89_02140 [Rubrivivax sp.]|nr:hypothetical protein [Rubrivivax sp.]